MKRILYVFHVGKHFFDPLPCIHSCDKCGHPRCSYEWYRTAVWENGHWAHYGANPDKVR